MMVYGYTRVSTAEQAKAGDSLDTQRKQIEAWALLKGWAVAETYIEAGVSGSVPMAERPEGRRLLARLNKGDVVITPKLDRMFRSASDALGTLEEMKEDGIALHMIDLGGDVTGNGIGKLTFTILAAVAENERERIRERIRDVKRHLAAEGIYSGGKVPFGYRVEGKGSKGARLVEDADAQAVLARMKHLRLTGWSYQIIGAEVGLTAMTVRRILIRTGINAAK